MKQATLEDLKLELFIRQNKRWFKQRKCNHIVWSKNGVEIPIKDMSDTHLLTTIDILEQEKLLQALQEEEAQEERDRLFDEECQEALSSIGDIDFNY